MASSSSSTAPSFADSSTAERRLRNRALEGNVAAIRLLVDGGADVNSANERGETALHCAAENGHVSAILALKELGANMDVRNEEQKTALEVAAANGHAHVLNHRGVWAAPRPDLLGVSAPRIAVAPAADVHWADTNQRRLRNRARAGDLEGIRELLAIGVDLVGNGSTDEVSTRALACIHYRATPDRRPPHRAHSPLAAEPHPVWLAGCSLRAGG